MSEKISELPSIAKSAVSLVDLIPVVRSGDNYNVYNENFFGGMPKPLATKIVAANNTPNATSRADYECSGAADDVEIQAALDALPAFGGTVYLLEGTYVLAASITTPADCRLEGRGWATILDVTGGSYGIIMGDRGTVRSLKMEGNIVPPVYTGSGITVGNHCVVERIWISESQQGIETANKTNIYIRDVRFDDVHDALGWANCIHASGTSNMIFVDGIYVDTADRGFEVENGAKNFYARNGYLKSVYVAGSYSFTLDAHGHAGGGEVENVVYENFYLEDCYGINMGGGPGSDRVKNITLKNIVVVDPYDGGSTTDGLTISLADHVVIDGLKIRTTTNAGRIYLANSVTDVSFSNLDIDMDFYIYLQGQYLTLRDSVLRNTNNIAALQMANADYGLIGNVSIYDIEGATGGIQIKGTCTDVTIRDNVVIAHAGTPGQSGIRIEAGCVDANVLDNVIEGAFTVAPIVDAGTNTIIKGNRNFVTENGGVSGAIATGGTIAHGCALTPKIVQVNAAEAGPTDITISVDAANITVNFGGGGNKTFFWHARVSP